MDKQEDWSFPVPVSADTTPMELPLRPGDTFYIGAHSCLIEVGEDTQVGSFAPANVESQYLLSNGQMANHQNDKTSAVKASNSGLYSDNEITVKETPKKAFRTKDAAKGIVGGASKNAMHGKEDSQNGPADPMRSADLHVPELSSPPPKGLKVEPTDTQDGTINPQLLQPASPLEKHSSEPPVGLAEQANGSAGPDPTSDNGDEETTDDELPPDALQNQGYHAAERSLFGDDKRNLMPMPSTVENATPVAQTNEEDVANEANGGTPTPLHVEKGLYDVKVVIPVNKEDNSGGYIASTLRRSSPGDVLNTNQRKRAAPADEEDSLGLQGPSPLVRGATRDSVTPIPIQRSSKRTKVAAPSNEELLDNLEGSKVLEEGVSNEPNKPMASPPRKKAPKKSPSSAQSKSSSKRTGKARASAGPAASFESSTSAPKEGSATPSSSFRSTRSGARDSIDSLQSPGTSLNVVFASSASVDQSKPFMKFLTNHGIKQVKDVIHCDILCVGRNTELKRTSNLITAVACGKYVVSDDWVTDSAKQGKLLDYKDYEAKDAEREKEWDTTLSDAIERSRQGTKALSDWSISFTPSAKKKLGAGFADIKQICVQAGAQAVAASTPKKSPQDLANTLVIAAEDDKDLEQLFSNGWTPYTKDVITYSILRGSVDTEGDEFHIEQPASKTPVSTGKKRTR